MVRVHLDEYLRDKNFDRTNLPPRGHEPTVYYGSSMGSQYGYNSGPGGQFQFTTMYPNQYPTFSPDEVSSYLNKYGIQFVGGGWRARHLKFQIQKFVKLHYLKIS